uniref:Ion transport domain-containing protein n=1 Tax=Clytia hemisphaerica TaxID=252671 RepID=A0A7M5UXY0_9CNID
MDRQVSFDESPPKIIQNFQNSESIEEEGIEAEEELDHSLNMNHDMDHSLNARRENHHKRLVRSKMMCTLDVPSSESLNNLVDGNQKHPTVTTNPLDADNGYNSHPVNDERRRGLANRSFRANWQIMSSSFNSDAPERTSDDNDDDGNTSDLSTNEYKSKTQPPLRSYRCSTNMAALQQFNAKMQSQSEGAEEGGEKKKDKFFSYEKSLYRSLFIFSEENIIRKVCRKITGNKIFDYFMLITIMANCIVLMAAEPLPENDTVELNKKLDQSDKVFVAIFIFEAILRIIANGFVIGQDAYLKSGWNILDFIVVISGAVHIITTFKSDPSSNKQTELIKALRAVRVLRPLKLVSGVPSLQVLMKSLIRAMVPLLQILLLVSFVIIIYSIVGLELLCGRFHYACFNATTQKLVVPISILKVRPCDPTGWGRKCNDGEICRRAKPHEWSGPNDGITSFDNMFLSMLTIFQCITLEGWSDILYYSLDSRDNSFQLIQWSAFILLIIVGSFFMLNLMLGVLSGEFAKERERVENRKNFLKLRKQRQIERSVDHYLHWISKAEDIIDEFDEEEEIEYENRCSPSGERRTSHYHHHHHSELARKRSRVSTTKRSKGNIFKRLERKFRFFIRRHLIKSKVFYWLVLILVLLNTVSMSLTKYNQQPDVKEVL